jgi:hypothetical protein
MTHEERLDARAIAMEDQQARLREAAARMQRKLAELDAYSKNQMRRSRRTIAASYAASALSFITAIAALAFIAWQFLHPACR